VRTWLVEQDNLPGAGMALSGSPLTSYPTLAGAEKVDDSNEASLSPPSTTSDASCTHANFAFERRRWWHWLLCPVDIRWHPNGRVNAGILGHRWREEGPILGTPGRKCKPPHALGKDNACTPSLFSQQQHPIQSEQQRTVAAPNLHLCNDNPPPPFFTPAVLRETTCHCRTRLPRWMGAFQAGRVGTPPAQIRGRP